MTLEQQLLKVLESHYEASGTSPTDLSMSFNALNAARDLAERIERTWEIRRCGVSDCETCETEQLAVFAGGDT